MRDEKYISEKDFEWERKKIRISPKRRGIPYLIKDGLGVPDEELIRLHTVEHLSASEIGKRIKQTDYMVRQRLKVLNVYSKGKRSLRRTDLNDKHIKFLYDRGYSPTEIGEIIGASRNAVLNHLKHINVSVSSVNTPVLCVRLKVLNHILDEKTAYKKFAHKKKIEGE
jgi:DNA-binding CsgD family transcriptional regulator